MTRRWTALFTALASGALLSALLVPTTTSGAFSGAVVNGGSHAAADALSAPTGLNVSFHCQLFGILLPVAHLSWTPTASAYAGGYVVDRLVGAMHDATTSVTGQASALLDDGVSLPHLSLSTTYTWHVRSIFHSWTSSDATISATTPALCT